MINRKIKIAIDGPAGVGKTTIAKKLTSILNLKSIDTGATYRAVTYILLKNGIDLDDDAGIKEALKKIKISFKNEKIYVNNIDVTNKIRTEKISKLTNILAANPIVRKHLRKLQKRLSKNGNCVMEGRDIGTVVMPDADFKFYLDATPLERAKRRYKELKKNLNFKKLLKSIQRRDHLDKTRGISPLKPAKDAIIIDTTNLSFNQVIEKILKIIKKSGKYH